MLWGSSFVGFSSMGVFLDGIVSSMNEATLAARLSHSDTGVDSLFGLVMISSIELIIFYVRLM